jgi:hypothetical protein
MPNSPTSVASAQVTRQACIRHRGARQKRSRNVAAQQRIIRDLKNSTGGRTMNKVETARELRSMVEERLFGDGPWSSDDPAVNGAVHEKLVALGLLRVDPSGNIHATDLGAELDVEIMSVFMGHHDPYEVPDCLVPLITQAEADELIFERFEQNGEKPEEVLPPLLRQLWRKHFAN